MTIEIDGARTVVLSNNRFVDVAEPFIINNCGEVTADNNHASYREENKPIKLNTYNLPQLYIYGLPQEYYLQGLIYVRD